MLYGYARVSSKEQHLERQIVELKKYVSEENIVIDKVSGKDINRPGYSALKGVLGLRPGDTLYVKSLDRLSRNKQDIKKELEYFRSNKIRVVILDLPTTMVKIENGQEWILDMINNILIEVLSSIAEQERITIKERQAEGIAVAKANGKFLGRPPKVKPKNWNEVISQWKRKEITAKEAMRRLEMSRSTFYAKVKEFEECV